MEGSKELQMTLTMTELFEQMKDQSYLIGESLKSNPQVMELAAKIQASDDDDLTLRDFAQAGGTKLGNILSRVLGKTSYMWDKVVKKVKVYVKNEKGELVPVYVVDGDSSSGQLEKEEEEPCIIFTTNAVANFMDSQKDTLKDSMLNYLSVYILSKWLNLIKPDESARFEAMLKELEEDMRQLGAQRDKPKRS